MAEAAAAELPALPDSVLLQVLALLPLRDRLRAARVCRRWRRLALDRTVWRHVDLSPHRISSQTLWHLVRQHLRDSLRTLRLRGALRSGGKRRLLSPALLAALEKRCPQLRRLCLAETDLRPIPYESIPPSLTALELSHCEIPAAWFCGPSARASLQLQHLVIRNVPAFSDRHLLNVSSQSRLKTLSLSGTYRLTDTGIQRAAPHLEKLERLVLRHCVISDSAVDFIGRHVKRLRFLEISSAYSLTNAGLASLATLQRLETLCLDLCDKISPSALIALCQALPQLRNLKLGGVRSEDQVIDKIQASLPHCSVSHTP
ncbi:F-box/LRR-repeat protein 12 [Gavia stellata]|uniref:F-box/LRR-repeat protein 12 n=1 Tax=Gavia stellata TaxID=37040 RepID=UPI00289EE56B|nr:F-box/LRR-repeat protein 12 [Gavia stellata]